MMLLPKAAWWLSHRRSVVNLQDHDCYCIQLGVTTSHRCSMVTNCKMLVVRYIASLQFLQCMHVFNNQWTKHSAVHLITAIPTHCENKFVVLLQVKTTLSFCYKWNSLWKQLCHSVTSETHCENKLLFCYKWAVHQCFTSFPGPPPLNVPALAMKPYVQNDLQKPKNESF